ALSIPFIGGGKPKGEEEGFWAAAARFVMGHPWPMAVGSAGLLIVMALPYFDINLGASGTTSLPEKYDARQAFDILDEKFSAGRIQPTEIVIEAEDLNDPAVQEGIAELQAAFSVDERYTLVNGVQVLREDPAGTDLALVSVTVPGESASDEAIDA